MDCWPILSHTTFFDSEVIRNGDTLCMCFGLALTSISVQTYINRRVPVSYQGRAFALQSVLKNGSAIVPLLTLGLAATVLSVRTVLILSPFVLLAIAVALVRLSVSFGGDASTRRLAVLSSYWEESHHPVSDPDVAAGGEHAATSSAEAGDDREHHPA